MTFPYPSPAFVIGVQSAWLAATLTKRKKAGVNGAVGNLKKSEMEGVSSFQNLTLTWENATCVFYLF